MFDHFVLRPDADPSAHISERVRGVLKRSTPEHRRTLRKFVVRALRMR